MISQNRFLQGIYPFEGAGLDKPVPISSELVHLVPDGVISQALYFRGGNTTEELITVVLMRAACRCAISRSAPRATSTCPCGWWRTSREARSSSCNSSLRPGISGSVIVDLGLVEH